MAIGETSRSDSDAVCYRLIVDASPDAVLVVDDAGRITFANVRATDMFGRPVDSLVGSEVDQLVPDAVRRAHRSKRGRFSHAPSERELGAPRPGTSNEFAARRADGTEFPVDIALIPVPAEEGGGIICVVRDARDRIGAERALLRSEARLHAEQRRVAVGRARERIGMDLHDGVIQSLYSVGMQLASAERRTADPANRADFAKAIDAIDVVIGEIRDYIHGLRPGTFDSRDLAPALFVLVAEFESTTDVRVHVDVDEEAAEVLSPWSDDCLHVVRELLSNVARHAKASNAYLSLVRDDDGSVVLQVTDDGIGFDPFDPHTGMGAGNIRRRVEPVGGVVDVTSTPGDGTKVHIRFAPQS